MKNKTALQTFIAWGDKMIKEQPVKHLSFLEAIDKAEELLEMEKEQIIDAYWEGGQDIPMNSKRCEQYYSETYNRNKQ